MVPVQVEGTPLCFAALNGHTEIAWFLIKAGADTKAPASADYMPKGVCVEAMKDTQAVIALASDTVISVVSRLTQDPHYKLLHTEDRQFIRAAHPQEVLGYLTREGGALADFRQQQEALRNTRIANRNRREAEIDRIHRENRTGPYRPPSPPSPRYGSSGYGD